MEIFINVSRNIYKCFWKYLKIFLEIFINISGNIYKYFRKDLKIFLGRFFYVFEVPMNSFATIVKKNMCEMCNL